MNARNQPAANISVELLADHPDLVPAIAVIRWNEWSQPEAPEELAWWVDITTRESGRDRIPVTWVAIDAFGRALGSVALDEFDIGERRDRSPWVVGVIVAAQSRGMGIGSRLMRVLESWAYRQGYSQAWVATGGRAVDFYQKCGWELDDFVNRPSCETVSILTKNLKDS